ncbi:peptide ABC transporter substrate-binding protein [Brevundimonas vesicularis]|uniref:peptide ABC transporter substrate-binding protein n=1 Tax=Brevundimonas vesicularis TaxID=41276 RepID=UPI0038D39207
MSEFGLSIPRRSLLTGGALLAGGVALAPLLASCGGGTGAAGGPAILRRGTSDEPRTLDPHFVPGNAGAALVYDMFEGLVSVDVGGKVIPGLAESWTVSDDQLTYRFTLRPGLKWSDGNPLTAEDFVYSFRRCVDPAAPTLGGRSLAALKNYRAIARKQKPADTLGVSAPDATTLVIEVEKPTSYLIDALAGYASSVVPRHAIEAHGQRWTTAENIVVSGAYSLASWVPNTSIQLKKNPHYYDAASTRIEEVVFYPVEKPATAVTRFRANELDVVFGVPADQLEVLRKSDFAQAIHTSPAIGVFYILLNNEKGPTQDRRVREALSLATDRDLITNQLLRDEGIPAYTIVPSAMPGYETPTLPIVSQSAAAKLERARSLLAQAGYSEARPLQITYKFGGQESNRRIAVALQSMWEEIGVKVTLENVGAPGVISDSRAGNYEAIRYQYYAPFQDPLGFLMLLQTGTMENLSRYSNPEFDAALTAADRLADPQQRFAALQALEAKAMEDHPVIPIYFNVRNYLVNPRIEGWVDNVRGQYLSRHLSLKA